MEIDDFNNNNSHHLGNSNISKTRSLVNSINEYYDIMDNPIFINEEEFEHIKDKSRELLNKTVDTKKEELILTTKILNNYHFYESAKFSGELLISFNPIQEEMVHCDTDNLFTTTNTKLHNNIHISNLKNLNERFYKETERNNISNINNSVTSESGIDLSIYKDYIESLFKLEEYKKCCHVIEQSILNNNEEIINNQYYIFLYIKSKLLSYQYNSDITEEILINSSSLNSKLNNGSNNNNNIASNTDKEKIRKKEIGNIQALSIHQEQELIKIAKKYIAPIETELNPFLNYIYAKILLLSKQKKKAISYLIKSLNAFPCFYECWKELLDLYNDYNINSPNNISLVSQPEPNLNSSSISGRNLNEKNKQAILFESLFKQLSMSHWMRPIFIADYLYSFMSNNYAGILLNLLQEYFQNNSFILVKIADLEKNDVEKALEIYQQVFKVSDPYRYENVDEYACFLAENEKSVELCNLAIDCSENNDMKYQNVLVIGKYFYSISNHKQSLKYFKNVIDLNPNYLNAYILLGHIYLEIYESELSIEAFRTCLNIDKTNSIAWYNLGHVYETNSYHITAIEYYLKSIKYNNKMACSWEAIGTCLQRTKFFKESAKCYEKALMLGNNKVSMIFNLGYIYLHELKKMSEGIQYYLSILENDFFSSEEYYYSKLLKIQDEHEIKEVIGKVLLLCGREDLINSFFNTNINDNKDNLNINNQFIDLSYIEFNQYINDIFCSDIIISNSFNFKIPTEIEIIKRFLKTIISLPCIKDYIMKEKENNYFEDENNNLLVEQQEILDKQYKKQCLIKSKELLDYVKEIKLENNDLSNLKVLDKLISLTEI